MAYLILQDYSQFFYIYILAFSLYSEYYNLSLPLPRLSFILAANLYATVGSCLQSLLSVSGSVTGWGGMTALMNYCGGGCFLATVFLLPQQSILAQTLGLFRGRLTVLRLCSYFYIFITRCDLLSMTEYPFGGSLGRCLTVGMVVYDWGCYLFYCCQFFFRFYYQIALRGSYILRFQSFFFQAFFACAFLYQLYSLGAYPQFGQDGSSCVPPPVSSYAAYEQAPFACMGLSSPVLAMVLAWDHLPSPPFQSIRTASSFFSSIQLFCWVFLPLLALSLIYLTLFFLGSI